MMPAFYQEKAAILPGDFALKQTFPDGTLIPRGTPIQVDLTNKEAGVVKVAKVVAGGTTTIPRVTKGQLFVVGDTLMKIGKADLSLTILAIDKSNASYDVITLSGALATLAAGDFLQECSEYAASSAGAVKGKYDLTITTNPTAGDKITINEVEYEFANAPADGKIVAGATPAATVVNIDSVLEQELVLTGVFDVTYKGTKTTFTQKVAGTGAIPTVEFTPVPSTGTLAGTIAETTAGVVGANATPAAPLYIADAVVEETKEIKSTNGFPTVNAAYETVVLRDNVYPIPDSWLTGYSLTRNHSIKYIKQ